MIYLVGCGSRATASLPELAHWCTAHNWDPWIVVSPTGAQFLDIAAAEQASGHPVFSGLVPEATAALPGADLVVVAPATFNTITKLAHAASDTLALAVTNEALGGGSPVVLVPWCNPALRAHPAFPEALATLSGWGYHVLDADQGSRLPWDAVQGAITALRPTAVVGA